MTEDQYNAFMQTVDQRFAKLEQENRTLREDVNRHERTIVDQNTRIEHLERQNRVHEVTIADLTAYRVEHNFEHDQERVRLKQRILLLEDTLKTHGIVVP